jgi:hypothetical protein
MKSKSVVVSLFTIFLLLTISVSKAAPSLPSGSNSPSQIEGYCFENGGTYWPPGPESSTYGCILPDGSVVVCGGSLPGCEVLEASAPLPPTKLPLAGINLTIGVQTKTQLESLQDKIDLIGLMVEDLAVLVEDECEPPIFVP